MHYVQTAKQTASACRGLQFGWPAVLGWHAAEWKYIDASSIGLINVLCRVRTRREVKREREKYRGESYQRACVEASREDMSCSYAYARSQGLTKNAFHSGLAAPSLHSHTQQTSCGWKTWLQKGEKLQRIMATQVPHIHRSGSGSPAEYCFHSNLP